VGEPRLSVDDDDGDGNGGGGGKGGNPSRCSMPVETASVYKRCRRRRCPVVTVALPRNCRCVASWLPLYCLVEGRGKGGGGNGDNLTAYFILASCCLPAHPCHTHRHNRP